MQQINSSAFSLHVMLSPTKSQWIPLVNSIIMTDSRQRTFGATRWYENGNNPDVFYTSREVTGDVFYTSREVTGDVLYTSREVTGDFSIFCADDLQTQPELDELSLCQIEHRLILLSIIQWLMEGWNISQDNCCFEETWLAKFQSYQVN